MWRQQTALLVLILTIPVCLVAQELYRCKTPAGRVMVSNAPCPAGSTAIVIESIGETDALPPVSANAPLPAADHPRRQKRALSRADSEPQVPVEECLHINDVATSVRHAKRRSSELAWKVDVSNRCKRSFKVLVTFGMYDKNDFQLRAARQRIRVPARDRVWAHGTMVVPTDQIQRISAKRAHLQWE